MTGGSTKRHDTDMRASGPLTLSCAIQVAQK
jgi:hypothetical protein